MSDANNVLPPKTFFFICLFNVSRQNYKNSEIMKLIKGQSGVIRNGVSASLLRVLPHFGNLHGKSVFSKEIS